MTKRPSPVTGREKEEVKEHLSKYELAPDQIEILSTTIADLLTKIRSRDKVIVGCLSREGRSVEQWVKFRLQELAPSIFVGQRTDDIDDRLLVTLHVFDIRGNFGEGVDNEPSKEPSPARSKISQTCLVVSSVNELTKRVTSIPKEIPWPMIK